MMMMLYTLLKNFSKLFNYYLQLIFIYFNSVSDEIYIAPSGVQKERILPEDIFIQNINGDDLLLPPAYKKYVLFIFNCLVII